MRTPVLVTALLVASAGTMMAQAITILKPAGDIRSMTDNTPERVRADWQLPIGTVSLTYSRPVFGLGNPGVPRSNSPWPVGDWSKPTLITTDKAMIIGYSDLSNCVPARKDPYESDVQNLLLGPGTYTINVSNSLAGGFGSRILLGKFQTPDQYPVPYQKSLELGQVPFNVPNVNPKEQVEKITFSITQDPRRADGWLLRLEWGAQGADVPFYFCSDVAPFRL